MITKSTPFTTSNMFPLADVKGHLRIEADYTLEDDQIELYYQAAHSFVEDFTNIAIGENKVFVEFLNAEQAEDEVYLSMSNVTSIDEVIEINYTTGEETTLTDYITSQTSLGTFIRANPLRTYKVTYKAGTVATDLPIQIKQAIFLVTAEFFEHREERLKRKKTSVEYLLNQVAIRRL
jgi:hypothetical protein